jgi:hypothetical protein
MSAYVRSHEHVLLYTIMLGQPAIYEECDSYVRHVGGPHTAHDVVGVMCNYALVIGTRAVFMKSLCAGVLSACRCKVAG